MKTALRLVLASLLLMPAAGLTAEVIEQVLVKVNGDIITKTELEQRQITALRQKMNGQIDPELLKDDARLKQALSEVTPALIVDAIDELLLLHRAYDMGMRMKPEYIKEVIENIKKENKIETDAQFQAALDQEGLTAWLEFCAGPLCAACPPDLRLLSLLSLESPEERHRRIESLVNRLRAQPRFRDRAFRLERLEPLDQVTASDLADFLHRKGNSSCPDDLIPVMPELIIADTGGHFERTVARIEEAERRSWYALHDELKDSAGHQATAATLPPEGEGPL